MKVEWEAIEHAQSGFLYRAWIPGGWLIKHVDDVLHTNAEVGLLLEDGHEFRTALCFVPDSGQNWSK